MAAGAESSEPPQAARKAARASADTLARVFRYITTVVISLISFIAVLSELGVSVAPILGAAGVVGLAVGW